MTTRAPVQGKQQSEGNRVAQSSHPQGVQQGVSLSADVMSLQRTAGNSAVNNLIHSLCGGSPLPMELRSEMEQRFGEDFSKVRMHTDARAAQSAAELSAKAYTFGNNIVFNEGRFSPGTGEGKRLLAHELTHVIQQQRGGSFPSYDPGAFHEQDADISANALVEGHAVVSVGGGTAVGIARNSLDDAEFEKRIAEIESEVSRSGLTKVEREKQIENINKIRKAYVSDPKKAVPALDALEMRIEQRKYGKPSYSEAPELGERALLEQGEPGGKINTKAKIVESAKLGEVYGRERAGAEDFIIPGPENGEKEWNPPQKHIGEFGRGIDDKGRRGDNIVIFEYKYGSSELNEKTGQMSNEWVGRKIAELQLEGDIEAAKELLEASQKGKLQGVVYLTEQVEGKDVATRLDKRALRRKLGRINISESGLITYAPGKVYKAYMARLKEFKEDEKLNRISLHPLVEPRSKSSKLSQTQASSKQVPKPTRLVPLPPVTILAPPSEPGGDLQQTPAPKLELPAKSAPDTVKAKPAPEPKAAAPVTEALSAPGAILLESEPTKPVEKKANPIALPSKPSAVPTSATVGSPKGGRIISTPTLGSILKGSMDAWSERAAKKMWNREALQRNRSVRKSHGDYLSTQDNAAEMIGEMIQDEMEKLNELGIQHRIKEELAKLQPTIKAYQEAHPNEGVLIAVQIETWDPLWRPTDVGPTRSFARLLPQFGGGAKEDAMARWLNEPKFFGTSKGFMLDFMDFIWIPPGQYVSLSKSKFINGRYLSSSDPARMLAFRFEDNGTFHCDAIDLRSGARLGVEVVNGWQINLNENSIKMTAKFFYPGNQAVVESEFYVLDSEWIQEHWKTNFGTSGDNFWHKADIWIKGS